MNRNFLYRRMRFHLSGARKPSLWDRMSPKCTFQTQASYRNTFLRPTSTAFFITWARLLRLCGCCWHEMNSAKHSQLLCSIILHNNACLHFLWTQITDMSGPTHILSAAKCMVRVSSVVAVVFKLGLGAKPSKAKFCLHSLSNSISKNANLSPHLGLLLVIK